MVKTDMINEAKNYEKLVLAIITLIKPDII